MLKKEKFRRRCFAQTAILFLHLSIVTQELHLLSFHLACF